MTTGRSETIAYETMRAEFAASFAEAIEQPDDVPAMKARIRELEYQVRELTTDGPPGEGIGQIGRDPDLASCPAHNSHIRN